MGLVRRAEEIQKSCGESRQSLRKLLLPVGEYAMREVQLPLPGSCRQDGSTIRPSLPRPDSLIHNSARWFLLPIYIKRQRLTRYSPIMATYLPGQQIALLDLPIEVLSHIVNVLPQEKRRRMEILNLRLTSKILHQVTDLGTNYCFQLPAILSGRDGNDGIDMSEVTKRFKSQLSIAPARSGDEADGRCASTVPTGPDQVAKLIKLQLTEIPRNTPGCWQWCYTLKNQLRQNPFLELEECILNLNPTDAMDNGRRYPLDITGLLQAPKLRKLTLEAVNVYFIDVEHIPKLSTPLKELRISRCEIDTTSLSAILGAPAALEFFDYTHNDWSGGVLGHLYAVHYDAREERESLHEIIRILAAQQPTLKSLKLIFNCHNVFRSSSYWNTLDLTPLTELKKLRLETCDCAESEMEWFSFMPFDKLPDCEVIEISTTDRPHIGLQSGALLMDWFIGSGIPRSLRELRFFTREDPAQPITHDQHNANNSIGYGISIFRWQLHVPRISYTQQGDHMKRTFSAMPDPNSEGYDIKTDVTTSLA